MPARRVDILRAACCVAAVDRKLAEGEQEALRLLASAAGIGDESLQGMLDRALDDEEFLADQLRLLHDNPVDVITTLLGIALADGRVTIDERVLIRYFAGKLGLSNEQFAEARSRSGWDGE